MTTETMTTEIEETSCDNCYQIFPVADLDDDSFCPACQALAIEEAAAEKREEEINDIQSDIDEADADLDGMMTEMQELQERIREAKDRKRAAIRKLARLGA